MGAPVKKALVTGAAAGLGLAIARRLIGEGWHVVAADRDATGLARLGDEAGEAVTQAACDFGDPERLEAVSAELAGQGPFGLAVLNAGINATGRFETVSADSQQALVAVNLTAPMVLTAALVRADAVSPGGRLVFVSSLSRYVGYPGAATYAATKEGVAVFARSVRRSLVRRGVKVLTVCPGPLDTAHAAEHAPPGADPGNRMHPDRAARHILAAAARPGLAGLVLGGNVSVPGAGPKAMALAGRLFPGLATRVMRRLIFEKM
jgi:short-subunit dehydrogenase